MKDKLTVVTFFDVNLIGVFWAHYFSVKKQYNENVEYFIGVDEVTGKNYKNHFEKLGIKFKIIKDEIKIFEKKSMNIKHITNFGYMRMLMFEMFPELENKKKLIYVDPDTIFAKRISEKYFDSKYNIAFLNTKRKKKLLYKATSFWRRKLISKPKVYAVISEKIYSGNYFNSGVLILNDISSIKLLFEKSINSDINVDDQNILNYFNDGEIKVVEDFTHNYQTKDLLVLNPVIYHFSGEKKPWKKKQKKGLMDKFNIYRSKYNSFSKNANKYKIYAEERKSLTLILTLYNPTKQEIKRWVKYTKIIINNEKYRCSERTGHIIDIHFLVDGTNVRFPRKFELENKSRIFKFKENKGKFKMVYDHIKSGEVNTHYFKVCDPDDYISVRKLFDYPLYYGNKIILYSFRKGKIKPLLNNNLFIERRIDRANKEQFNSFGNAWTILPVSFIKNDVLYSGKRIYYHDDQLFGYLAYQNGAEILKEKGLEFYYYIDAAGHTGYRNIKDVSEKAIHTFEELKKINSVGGRKNPVTWPNEYTYYYHKINEYIKKTKGYDSKLNSELHENVEKIIDLKAF